MYEIVRRTEFKNPSDYEVCKKRFLDELPDYTVEFGEDNHFIVEIEDDGVAECDAEDIFGDFEWDIKE